MRMGNLDEAITAAIAKRLREARAAVKPEDRKTFPELALEIGTVKTTLLNYFNGHRAIPTPMFVSICAALDIDGGALLNAAYADVRRENQ